VANGSRVVVTAAADAGSRFSGWDGGCSGTSSCEVVVDRDLEVRAAFDAAPRPPGSHDLTVVKNGSGTVSSNPTAIDCGRTCSAALPDGTKLALMATADSGWRFAGWGGGCSGPGGCAVTLDKDVTVFATFEAIPPPNAPGWVATVSGGDGDVLSVATDSRGNAVALIYDTSSA